MKRSLSASPTPPPSTSKKVRAKSARSSPSAPATPGNGWTNEKKATFVKILVDTGYRNMDWAKLAAETGMTEAQCKNQLTPGRSNLAKTLNTMFEK